MPQLRLSVWRSRQTPVQSVVPATHDTTHTPREQSWPDAQERPHMPQWLVSVVRSRQTPVQLVVPDPHDTVHTPAEHT
jgi:hypothetical protein